ncbi:hypothetical protein Goarm_010202 [Gossypium armourianum]|uniref:RNase H type-1 domain-containing protein n=1 Tax=Gossypium armourianum TaxID=34283 RepID=A0A7J9JVF8_9ROSI|nr:hypothetical protein [Gossypium armourianum]
MDCTLKELVTSDSTWNLDLFCIWLSDDVINRIVGIPPPHPDSGLDGVIWARLALGFFSIRNAYCSLKDGTWNPREELWKNTWKYQGLFGSKGSVDACDSNGASTKVHLLTDVVVARDSGNASTGGVLRDQLGNWILGFNRGHKRATIQTDNPDEVQALFDILLEDSGITVFRRVQRIMRSEGRWRIRYVPREHNIIVDRLAKLCLTWKSSL